MEPKVGDICKFTWHSASGDPYLDRIYEITYVDSVSCNVKVLGPPHKRCIPGEPTPRIGNLARKTNKEEAFKVLIRA